MPFNKEQMKEWREANKEKIKEQTKEYREKNKEKIKEYYEKNKEKEIKRCIIKNWKQRGIKSEDYDKLYEYYINVKNCELCEIELEKGYGFSNKKHLDHNHENGEVRNVLCGSCNIKRK